MGYIKEMQNVWPGKPELTRDYMEKYSAQVDPKLM